MSSVLDACSPSNLLRNDRRRLRHFGVVQVMVGIINLTFGVPLYFAAPFVIAIRLWVPWWTGILFVISGALTMLNVDSPEPRVKKLAMIFNFVSAIAAALGAVAYILSTMISGYYLWRSPMLILILLFMYCVVELFIALLVGIILCKN
ncbi:membrane-spanning 4-domains subfamily A member 12-like isoform X1 [Chiloscyllium plagiosum]|uniref:membrane-spanning 4-domains subfamily A member 12-like isoform X1 n=2 Tax=Chiloscyllium plagiosum TaxID=36176 RepID=UPI001CB87CB8|nr:membrane-spanning 4-domains subfamily A member 12-like isoform X1 [Chiloscyllium plagiosum]